MTLEEPNKLIADDEGEMVEVKGTTVKPCGLRPKWCSKSDILHVN